MPITAASLSLAIYWSSSILGRRLLMLICTKRRPLFLRTTHWSLLCCCKPLIGPGLRLISPEVIVAIGNKSYYSGTWDWKNETGSALDWHNFILHLSFEILQRYCKLVVLGTLSMLGNVHQKWYYLLVGNFRVSLQANNQLHPPMLSWSYCKNMPTFYFKYFGHAWLHTPRMTVSTFRTFQNLSTCQK